MLPVVAAVFVVVAAVAMGQAVGQDAAFVFRLVALPVLALAVFGAIYLWYRRKSAELIVARYHLKGDALGWRRFALAMGTQVRVCAECGAIVPDFRAQEEHVKWHEDLATLLAGEQLEPAEDPPWTAVTEKSTGLEPEPVPELPDETQPAQVPELPDVGEYESRARAFRASMDRHKQEGRRTDATV